MEKLSEIEIEKNQDFKDGEIRLRVFAHSPMTRDLEPNEGKSKKREAFALNALAKVLMAQAAELDAAGDAILKSEAKK